MYVTNVMGSEVKSFTVDSVFMPYKEVLSSATYAYERKAALLLLYTQPP